MDSQTSHERPLAQPGKVAADLVALKAAEIAVEGVVDESIGDAVKNIPDPALRNNVARLAAAARVEALAEQESTGRPLATPVPTVSKITSRATLTPLKERPVTTTRTGKPRRTVYQPTVGLPLDVRPIRPRPREVQDNGQ